MSVGAKSSQHTRAEVWNFPNQVTISRLVLAVVLFVVIAQKYYLASMVLFIVAASTDWLDGWYARRYGQVTTLGRILDPFADKVIICGTFIFLTAIPAMLAVPWGLRPWMVVVLVGREILVTALRSFFEERGSDFSANWSGKLKFIFQCIAAGAALYYLSYPNPIQDAPAWVRWTVVVSVWAAVIQTVYSGLVYVAAAMRLARGA